MEYTYAPTLDYPQACLHQINALSSAMTFSFPHEWG